MSRRRPQTATWTERLLDLSGCGKSARPVRRGDGGLGFTPLLSVLLYRPILFPSPNRNVHLIVVRVQRLNRQRQIPGSSQEGRQCYVELVQPWKSRRQSLETHR